MAKLPPLDFRAQRIRSMLDEGRRVDAIAFAIAELRKSKEAPLFMQAVASLLESEPSQRGRPTTKMPPFWYEIGSDFEEMRDAGETYEAAVQQLAERWRRSERSVERAIAFWRDAKEAHDEASRQ
jgi:hypothetical protein